MSEIAISNNKFRVGVGIMLLNARGRVLIGRRNDVEGGAWQMPQGGIDKGEDPRIGALRELKEEIGTDNVTILAESKDWYQYCLPSPLNGKAWGGRYVGQRQKWFLMRFGGRDEEIILDLQHAEFDGWLWVPPDDLSSLVVSFKRQLYSSLVEEFRPMCRPIAK